MSGVQQSVCELTPDSKALSAETRQALWDSFELNPPLCYSSATLSPQAISAGMLRRAPINLNQQAQVGVADLFDLHSVLAREGQVGV
jgi:hypothetical protein